jgi:hypothetical protein
MAFARMLSSPTPGEHALRFFSSHVTKLPVIYRSRPRGACPSNPALRGEGATGRGEVAGSKKPDVYSLEYVGFFGAENDADYCRSLPQENGMTRTGS